MADSVEKLAYDEAVRGLESQRASLDALRNRTGTLMAAAALVTTFIGGRALQGDNSAWTTVAIIAFVAVMATTFIVLLMFQLAKAIGSGGVLPPMLAAGAPKILVGVAAGYLLRKAPT